MSYNFAVDIATHALIGTATAAGLFHAHPALAVGLVLGNVAPDLDALSRVAGKLAFLRFHQTYTHSVGAVAAVLTLASVLLVSNVAVWGELAIGLAIGMAMHVGLDLTNSYGVKCLWPLSQRRFALDWIFFIDAPVVVLCTVILVAQFLSQTNEDRLRWLSVIFVMALASYVALRSFIAGRAKRWVNSSSDQFESASIIPTTWSPFRFLVCRQQVGLICTFAVDAKSGRQSEEESIAILDQSVPQTITGCREWQVMRSLSAFFVCVEIESDAESGTYTCEDLRIRNFGAKFGRLTCRLDSHGAIQQKTWDV